MVINSHKQNGTCGRNWSFESCMKARQSASYLWTSDMLAPGKRGESTWGGSWWPCLPLPHLPHLGSSSHSIGFPHLKWSTTQWCISDWRAIVHMLGKEPSSLRGRSLYYTMLDVGNRAQGAGIQSPNCLVLQACCIKCVLCLLRSLEPGANSRPTLTTLEHQHIITH